MQIEKGSCENPENIPKISRIHHVKYLTEGKTDTFHVWQYYGIGEGKRFPVGMLPETPAYTVTVPFQKDHSFGNAMVSKKPKKEIVYCAESMCKKKFDSVDEMLDHFNYQPHDYVDSNTVSQLSTVSDNWVKRFAGDDAESTMQSSDQAANVSLSSCDGESKLRMGWAIPQRVQRRLSNLQKNFLNQLFDEGEITGAKVTGEQALKLMKEKIDDPSQFLPLSTIKSYFGRRAKSLREGKAKIGETFPVTTDAENEESDDEEDQVEEEEEEEEEEVDQLRTKTVSRIMALTDVIPDLSADDWIAVDMGATWYPGQFINYDIELEELQVNFLHRSSSNCKWFVWPLLQLNGVEDKSVVPERSVFYRLNTPKEGRRETLIFEEYDEVERVFKEIKQR
jgi:hypothetical protein